MVNVVAHCVKCAQQNPSTKYWTWLCLIVMFASCIVCLVSKSVYSHFNNNNNDNNFHHFIQLYENSQLSPFSSRLD